MCGNRRLPNAAFHVKNSYHWCRLHCCFQGQCPVSKLCRRNTFGGLILVGGRSDEEYPTSALHGHQDFDYAIPQHEWTGYRRCQAASHTYQEQGRPTPFDSWSDTFPDHAWERPQKHRQPSKPILDIGTVMTHCCTGLPKLQRGFRRQNGLP